MSWKHQLYTIFLFDGYEKGWKQLTYLPLWKQRQWECFHLSMPQFSSPITSSAMRTTMYTAHQQWWWVTQRLQWSFAGGTVVGYGQQQKWEQRNSDLYLVATSYNICSSPFICLYECFQLSIYTAISSVECMLCLICMQCDTTCAFPSACHISSPATYSLRSVHSHCV